MGIERLRRVATAAVMGTVLSAAAAMTLHAQELSIGYGASITSMDPHYHALQPNITISNHFFDALVEQDEHQKLKPGLAVSWKAISDTVWEFKLRPGVKFTDGHEFTAEDVIASVKRVAWVPNSPSPFTIYTSSIKDIEVVDPLTIHFVTKGPAPLLPSDLVGINIVSKTMVEAPTVDFNTGKAMVGTGAYKFVEYQQGNRVVMERNENYWGEKQPWSKVTFRIMTNEASRMAAFLAGDIQVVDAVPSADVAKLKANKDVNVVNAVSNRLIFLHFDHQRDQTPWAFDKQGKPLPSNPLKDVRVRKAMSKAINRQLICDRIMEGQGIPASQFLDTSFFGTSPNLKVEPYDPEGAKKLLAEAGYPNGFQITLHGPNDRYINDAKILPAVAQMLARIGIDAKVELSPWATFASRATKQELSVMLVGWGAQTGEVSSSLRSLVATYDPAKGMGTSNRGRYSNKEVDALITQALTTIDDDARAKLLAKASEVSINDVGVLPLHYEVSYWATKKGLNLVGRADQELLVMGLKPAS